ncbi:hypothetical protein [Mesorhizobium sp.]|uniref:hypothetical protein n=1 Tax=Mesorhizobium sp. TaxID=1871066 RepID=UPI0012126643|nr:hypothetical protein [Mesorhizobium sp.]TIL65615.1 MAG: hypothetical protein E5Y77_20740 [Mesorhizobium sp.]
MKSILEGRFHVVVAAALAVSPAAAQGFAPLLERHSWQRSDITEHLGQTYLQTFLTPVVGIDDEIDGDFSKTIKIVDADTIIATIQRFDPNVAIRIFRDFRDGELGFVRALEGIEGKTLPVAAVYDTIKAYTDPEAKPGKENYAQATASSMALLASGSGTLVILDDANYFYNVGYEDNITGSGRSYGISKGRKLLDASDNDYLSAITAYLGPSNQEPQPFFRVMLDILARSDTTSISALSGDGQAVITDLMTVYTAELERNEMKDLSPTVAAWQTDLAEVTLLASYGGISGMVMKEGQLVSGPSNEYYSSGGIGTTRPEFMRLGRLITKFMEKQHPEIIFQISALTPIEDPEVLMAIDGDIFRRALIFLNRRETTSKAQENAGQLRDAVLELLVLCRTQHAGITTFVKASLP